MSAGQLESLRQAHDALASDQQKEQLLDSLTPQIRQQLQADLAERSRLRDQMQAGLLPPLIEFRLPMFADAEEVVEEIDREYGISLWENEELADKITSVEPTLRCQLDTRTGDVRVLGLS